MVEPCGVPGPEFLGDDVRTQQTPKQLANETIGYLQDACGDAASGMLECPGWDDKWDGKIKHARKLDIRDIHGWLSDEMWSDADTLEDLVGDHVADLAGGDEALKNAIYSELQKHAHPALKTAIDNIAREE
jgi:hypothetical protein